MGGRWGLVRLEIIEDSALVWTAIKKSDNRCCEHGEIRMSREN